MAKSDAEGRAKEAQAVVERIRSGLLRAHRTIYRAGVRSQNDIGTGRPGADDEHETSLGQRLHTDSYRDLVVLGFWHEGMNSPKYVCSTSGMNIVRAVRAVGGRTLEIANSWRSKDRTGVYQDFLREARKLEPDVQELDADSRRLVDRHELDMLRMRRTLGVAFQVSEAEARMASYLMRHDVAAVVHVYSTDSPCSSCSRTYADLRPALDKVSQRLPSVATKAPDQKAPARVIPGLDWRIGWLFYGQAYAPDNREKATDFRILDAAVKAGSIEGHARL